MFKKIVQFLSVAAVFTYFLGYLGGFHWALEIFAHFRVYYLLFFSILIALTILVKERVSMALNILMLLVAGWPLLDYYGAPKYEPHEDDLKILYANVLRSNSEFSKITDFIEQEDPDVIIISEVDSAWHDHLKPFSNKYRSSKFVLREDNFGICAMSKFKLYQFKTLGLSPQDIPSLGMVFRSNGKYYSVIGTHTIPPSGTRNFNFRNTHFDNINSFVKKLDMEAIVIGDLNCTPFSPSFSRITNGTTLSDSRIGFGIQATWSAKNILFNIPIDHCLTTEGIQVVDRRVGPDVGSDHYPIVVTMRARVVKDPEQE